MGQANRIQQAIGQGPCPCGSPKPAKACCYSTGAWYKAPARLGLKAMAAQGVVNKCYMRELGSCRGPISSEHLISHAVVRALRADGDFTISGVPWLAEGEEKVVSQGGLTAKCLCSAHNSALSPIDAAAGRFFSALQECFAAETTAKRFIVSGHDIERWLLKTARALAVSKNLARSRQPLSGNFARSVDVLELLDNPQSWPAGAGLYCTMGVGDVVTNHSRFRLQPLTNDKGEIAGIGVEILGLMFVLLLQPPGDGGARQVQGTRYRPDQIEIRFPGAQHHIVLSWLDGALHGGTLTMRFLQKVRSDAENDGRRAG